MAQSKKALGEKPLFWIGSAKRDLLGFPDAVKDGIGIALSVAQFGGKHPSAKPWKGEGAGVLEIVEDYRGHLPGCIQRKVRERYLRIACVPEEIAERHKDGPNGCGIGFSETQGSKRGLRGAIWQGKEIAKLSLRVQVTCLRILVYPMLARSKHECVWRLQSIGSLRHVVYRKLQPQACSPSINRRFLPW